MSLAPFNIAAEQRMAQKNREKVKIMEIEYQLTPQDLSAFTHYHQQLLAEKGKDIPQWVWGIPLILIMAYFLLAPRLGIGSSEFIAFLVGCSVMMVWLVSLLIWRQRANLRRQNQLQVDERNRFHYEVKRMTISPEGITVTGSHSVVTNRWPMIWHIGKTCDHAFFYIGLDTAFVVPRRAFRNERHFEEFVALALRYQLSQPPRGSVSGAIPGTLPAEQAGITLSLRP
jgi:hypothetical protein